MPDLQEAKRLEDPKWKNWGPYVSDRQWGTVREDYSAEGDAWRSTTHDMARSKAWRWGEEGIGGISDSMQQLCFAWSFWNKKDPILKERFFGLTNFEGNHGEDVKELYYYLDSTPTHSYMKMLYKYPIEAFPYELLKDQNAQRTKMDPEYELIDTGVLDNNKYFDIQIEYAKAGINDMLIRVTIKNMSDQQASINILPTVWFSNDWSWFKNAKKPNITKLNDQKLLLHKDQIGKYYFYYDQPAESLFCENETNNEKLYKSENEGNYVKDGINDFITLGNAKAINLEEGTKVSIDYDTKIEPGKSVTFDMRLGDLDTEKPFLDFHTIFDSRKAEADAFYNSIQSCIQDEDEKLIQRQAFSGMLWNKQFYHYNVDKWLNGDDNMPSPPLSRKQGRNKGWKNIDNRTVISMPDKWEYPWYATWDMAFHCVNIAVIDSKFAKEQLQLFTHEWYMHANGQLPAYEWDFGNVNPPVHGWSAWRVYKIDEKNTGKGDMEFLKSIFHKLLLNFTWWVNRKDEENNNVFEGGFLGLDNIGIFDRNTAIAQGLHLEQSDATSWMAMFALNMMRISLELCKQDEVYQDMASKFFEHFLSIAEAMEQVEANGDGLWDEKDEFYYDQVHTKYGECMRLRLKSIVGVIPLFAVEVIDDASLDTAPLFKERMNWIFENKPELAALVSRWKDKNDTQHLLSLLRGHRMKKILERVLDENEFLSDYGIRSVSKVYQKNPFILNMDNLTYQVNYTPGESDSNMFGGNSNWRGPIWMPINFLIIESLQRFHFYYGDDFKIECPTRSGQYLTISEVADFISNKIIHLFKKDDNGHRAFLNGYDKIQNNPDFNNYILFHEYFHGDSGKGLGASHQTGWTGLVAKIIQSKNNRIG